MGRFLLRESPALPWGATLVVVTPILTDELVAALDQLRAAGRQIVLVSLAHEPPPNLAGILAYHLPEEDQPKRRKAIIEPNIFAQWREANA
jgi:hypothetical protein